MAQPFRRYSLGRELVRQALAHSDTLFGPQANKIAAQQHLEGFYNEFGYGQCGPMYVEDGIPHIPMRRAASAGRLTSPRSAVPGLGSLCRGGAFRLR